MTIGALFLAGTVVVGQTPRFQGPLGLNKVLSGKISKAKLIASSSKDAAKYVLTTDDGAFQLHGHEKELQKLVGKSVRVTGKTVGENVTVDSVERLKEK